MKKILLATFVLFVSIKNISAQDPEIVGTWYLKAFTTDLGDPEFINNNDAPQNPTLTIFSDYTFEGIGACNMFTGQFEYDPVEDVYVHTSFNPTTDNCGNSGYNNFENLYFSFFNDSQDPFLRYVNTGSGNLVLELSTPGFGMEFQDSVFLGINENLLDRISVYPTITSDYLIISRPISVLIEQIAVFNTIGQKVLVELGNNDEINIASLSTGIYFIQISSKQGNIIKKFIKK